MRTIHPTPRPSFFSAATLAALTLAALGGCEVADSVSDSDLALDEAPAEIERAGVVFERDDLLVDEVPTDAEAAVVMPRRALPEEPTRMRALNDYSRDELADALRPVIAAHGYTYVAQDPNYAAADAVLSGDQSPRAVDFIPRADDERGEVLSVDDGIDFREIIGDDGRNVVFDTTAAPYNAVVRLELFTDDMYRGWCSGSNIGPWTLITSAHCLVFSDTDRINRIRFQPARTGTYFPYGSHDCRLDDASASNDFLWAVPNGYMQGQADELDYAVLDTYPCHAAPAWFGGYQANAGAGTFSTYGYPGDRCPQAPTPGTFMCGMSGPANLNDWRIETEHIDSVSGQSGSPWWRTFDIDRPTGVLWGYREYYDFWQCGFDACRRNFARRIDNAFSQFIVDVAWDY